MVADVPLCSSPQIGRIVRTGPLASQSERRRANGRRASVSPAGIAHPRIWRASRSAHHRHQRASRIDESGGRRATKVLGCSRTAMAQPSPANVFDHQPPAPLGAPVGCMVLLGSSVTCARFASASLWQVHLARASTSSCSRVSGHRCACAATNRLGFLWHRGSMPPSRREGPQGQLQDRRAERPRRSRRTSRHWVTSP